MDCENAKKILSFEGLISAPFTAFTPEGEVNLEVTPKYIDHLVSQGVKGAYVNGTTGEGLSLSVKERKLLAEQWVKHGKKKLDLVIIHVGANSLKDAQELASHAEKIGATGIASLPPLFFKLTNLDQLVDYFKEISKAAPSTPLMLYHIPSYSDVEISVGDFLPKARQAIPTFIGAKFTSVDVRDLLRCHKTDPPQFKILSGFDETLLPCLSCGVTAAIGATYNFMGSTGAKVLDAYKKGNIEEARKISIQILDAVEKITRHGQGISCFKATMNHLMGPRGLDFGPPRAPLFPLEAKALENLKKDLKSLKAEAWIKP